MIRNSKSNHNWEIPNPFIKADGTLIGSADEWASQKRYLQQILEEDLYGHAPEYSGDISSETEYEENLWDGKAVFRVYRLTFDHSFSFRVAGVIPAAPEKSIPIVLTRNSKNSPSS